MHAKSSQEIELMREAGRINALAHQAVQNILQPGVTTRELDAVAEQVLRANRAESSFRQQYRFPGTACVSINDEVAHGIPGSRRIQAGDVVKVDIGAAYQNLHSDSAVTHCVGSPEPQTQHLLSAAQTALTNGIQAAVAGNRVSDISHAIFSTVEPTGYELLRHSFGHGIGRELHEDPQIANFGPPNRGPRLRPGMTLAIEPVMTGGSRLTYTKPDGWTTVTVDGSLGVHYEHTVLITEEGPEILTQLPQSAITAASTLALEGDCTLHLQAATSTDLEVLFAMAARNLNKILIEAWGRPVERSIFSEKGAVTNVITTETGDSVGFYTYRVLTDHLELITLVIDQPYKHSGYGRRIMHLLHEQAQSLGFSRVELCVQSNNERAIRFYEQLGYHYHSSPYYNTLLLRKLITAKE